MRTIKFRRPYFRFKTNQFSFFDYWGPDFKENDRITQFKNPASVTSCYHKEDQQFTGLSDNQGKEIYEGDIIKIKDGEMVGLKMGYEGPCEEYRDLITKVYYEGSSFVYLHPNGDCPVPVDYSINDCVIIGNIYKSPELLNQEEKK